MRAMPLRWERGCEGGGLRFRVVGADPAKLGPLCEGLKEGKGLYRESQCLGCRVEGYRGGDGVMYGLY